MGWLLPPRSWTVVLTASWMLMDSAHDKAAEDMPSVSKS
jgi:hypothetical protein